MVKRILRRLVPPSVREFVSLPPFPSTRLTAKRLFNLYLARYEQWRGRVTVRSLPIKLTVEPAAVCNLRCPACFTGVGEVGRSRSMMSLDLYRALLDELGDYLFGVELCNWGEPLLSKDIYSMVEAATARGLTSLISTNFSVPFDAERAERLVQAGLSVLGVSIDGATQESYEKYRVRGNLETVLNNCRLIVDAKQKLGSKTPQLYWVYHVFPHNVDEVDLARRQAAEMGMTFVAEKGWVVGDEWNPTGPYKFFSNVMPGPCIFLWQYAVVNNDGGVAPCCGSFYREDDMGKIVQTAPQPMPRFRDVWNGARFQQARRFFLDREGEQHQSQDICFDCPQTVVWDRWKRHKKAGGSAATFEVGYSTNDAFNYFFRRRENRRSP